MDFSPIKILHKLGRVHRRTLNFFEFSYSVLFYHWRKVSFAQKPEKVLVALTYWCNSRCAMCNIWKMKPKHELSVQEWGKMLGDPIFEKIKTIDVTGGEALLHPKFNELLELFINSLPFLKEITLVSNGFSTELIITKVKKLAQFCQKNNIRLSVSISLDGVGKTHDEIRGIQGGFKKATQTIKGLKKISKKYNFSIYSGSLVLKQNISKVDEITSWYNQNKVEHDFQIVGFHDTYVRNLDTLQKVNFSKKQDQELRDFLKKKSKRKRHDDFRAYYWRDLLAMYFEKKPRTTPCPFQRSQFALDSFGDVYYCFSERKIGSWRKSGSVSKIYYDPKNIEFRKKMTQTACLKCNSGCNVQDDIERDFFKYAWFCLTGNPWYGFRKK